MDNLCHLWDWMIQQDPHRVRGYIRTNPDNSYRLIYVFGVGEQFNEGKIDPKALEMARMFIDEHEKHMPATSRFLKERLMLPVEPKRSPPQDPSANCRSSLRYEAPGGRLVRAPSVKWY